MHAGFPCLTQNFNTVLTVGAKEGRIDGLLERAGGKLLAHGMAAALNVGLGFVMRGSLLSHRQGRRAEEFFRENFEIIDPEAPGGRRYYQGKILVRTDKPEDDMNVLLKFCPNPEKIFTGGVFGALKKTLFGTALQGTAVVGTEVLSEEEAARRARDPEAVDLVISFKDVKTIVGLVGRRDLEIGSLLLENVVRMKGNVGHLFKFGAIGVNIQLALGLT